MSKNRKRDRGFFDWLWAPFELFFELIGAILSAIFSD
ncbi:hypothetical protein AVU32_gp268 [Vibrio phage ValKK3]|uniref:Uncharacterized protein n=1 Tax=Vibrio phage ValKK3 TaxID=1610855 RepID=A0A0D4DAW9_9CAUD|nr:hypothetical protein AVU32_gp268 [Vibrio phage ValKK3]QBX06095.1 hypothetical protein Va3_141 [Vibrio phage Va3]QNJ54721.1 hypothetical protein vBValMR10Z_180 [Vibrio phage vB_ValM_R10Z]QNJ55107.1 hypothetical protein vBValMR11Z_181 [Vibrio phage vB_ValM_R11Z]URQ03578.1 hypothetical protein PVA23_201 [Vibrio phage PVA23]AJT61109.1 hypothetical protein [Vibrio phage ValKK3]